jgi:diguanylate cyclase (GGDEF)-like protein
MTTGEQGHPAPTWSASLLPAFQYARVGLAIVSADGRVEIANQEMMRIVGGPVEDWSAFPPAVRELATGSPGDCTECQETYPTTGVQARWTITPAGTQWIIQAEDVTVQRRLEDTLALEAERLKTIAALHREVEQAEFDVDEVVDWILDRARTLFGASGAAVGVIEGEDIVYRFASGSARPGIRTPIGKSLSGICVRTGEAMHCDDSEQDPRVDIKACRAAGLRSMIIVPLRHRGRIVGVLNLLSPEPNAFSPSDVYTVELIGGGISAAYGHAADLAAKRALLDELQAAVAALKESEAKLAYQALHDPLTGLPNRTLFMDRLQVALAQSPRRRARVAVLYLDLDRFKEVNDRLGHDAGDALLIEVARRLSCCLRTGDTAARLGGDEFTVVCDGLRGLEDAVAVAERITAALAVPVTVPGGELRPTVSIGIALNRGREDTPDTMLKRADTALYRAKAAGRACYRLDDAEADATPYQRA